MKVQFLTTRKVLLAVACGLVAIGAAASAAESLGVKKAREVLQGLAGANLKKEQVQIKSITPGTSGDAIVEAQVETAFRLVNEKGHWRVADIRLGDRQWESFDLVEEAIRREKVRRTSALLKQLTDGVEAYRKARGQAPPTDNIGRLLDYLSPTFLNPPVRFDLWGRQIEYRGGGDGYRIVSAGPDRKMGTGDDLVVENGTPKYDAGQD